MKAIIIKNGKISWEGYIGCVEPMLIGYVIYPFNQGYSYVLEAIVEGVAHLRPNNLEANLIHDLTV